MERMYQFALCFTDTNPLSCRTGHIVVKTFRTLAAARQRYSETVKPGFYVAERQGDKYVRIGGAA